MGIQNSDEYGIRTAKRADKRLAELQEQQVLRRDGSIVNGLGELIKPKANKLPEVEYPLIKRKEKQYNKLPESIANDYLSFNEQEIINYLDNIPDEELIAPIVFNAFGCKSTSLDEIIKFCALKKEAKDLIKQRIDSIANKYEFIIKEENTYNFLNKSLNKQEQALIRNARQLAHSIIYSRI